MHHITSRSNAEEHIFKDGGDYATGIRILAELVSDGLVVCHAFCFMPTHHHVLVTAADVTKAVHRLNRRYAVAFNRRYKRRGQVFNSPPSVTEIDDERYFQELTRYVALNPKYPETWPYSSYPGLIGTGRAFSFVDPAPIIEEFGTAECFRAFVDEARGAEDVQLGSGFAGNRVRR